MLVTCCRCDFFFATRWQQNTAENLTTHSSGKGQVLPSLHPEDQHELLAHVSVVVGEALQ